MFSSERRLVEYQVRGQNKTCYVLDKISSSTDAYLIGLLCADAGFSLSKNKYQKIVFYTSKSWLSDIVSKFFNGVVSKRVRDISITNAQGKKYDYQDAVSYEVSLPSKTTASLGKFGICSLKPQRVMSGIPDKYFKSAILGFMDGDGSIVVCHRKDCRTPRLNIHFVTSCEKVLIHIQRHLENFLNISSSIYSRNKKCFELRINNTSSAVKFCNWIYSDLPDFYDHKKKRIFDEYISCVSSDELLESRKGQSAAKPTE